MSVLGQVLVRVGVLGCWLVAWALFLFVPDIARADEPLANAVERVDLRSAATRHYRKSDGTMVAVTSAVSTHFRTGGGAWQPIEPTLALAGDGTAERQGSSVRLRSDESGLHLTDAHGRGLVWLLPRRAEVRSDGATAELGGTQWHYTLTANGIKAESRIDKPRGAQTYRFPFDLAGEPGRVEIDVGGNAVLRGILQVPRALVFGADGKTYRASAWRLASINSATQPVLEFDFDDSELAAAAFPLVLDPTTYAAADTVGGGITGTSSAYATARATSNGVAPGAATMTVGQSLSGSSHTVARGFLSFPTGSIPADATIEEVRLEMRATDANVDTDFSVEVRQHAWGAPLADTREANYDGCLAAALDGVWSTAAALDPNDPLALSEALDPTWVAKGGYGETRYCLLSSRDAAGLAPSGDEAIELAADDDPNDYPRLIIGRDVGGHRTGHAGEFVRARVDALAGADGRDRGSIPHTDAHGDTDDHADGYADRYADAHLSADSRGGGCGRRCRHAAGGAVPVADRAAAPSDHPGKGRRPQ